MGNSEYEHMGKLSNAVNDAKAFKDVLRKLGFEVRTKFNLGRGEMLHHFSESFQCLISEIVVYYSGHGVSIG